MSEQPIRKSFIVTKSDVPVLRAGWGNMLFFFIVIWSILLYQILIALLLPGFVRIAAIALFWLLVAKIYAHQVSKIYFEKGKSLFIVCSFYAVEISADEFLGAKIYDIPSSKSITIKLKRKDRLLSSYYHFVAIQSDYGTFADTKAKLISLLNEFKSYQED